MYVKEILKNKNGALAVPQVFLSKAFGLTLTEAVVLSCIVHFSKKNTLAELSNTNLVDLTGCAKNTVKRALKSLQEKNLIVVAYENRKRYTAPTADLSKRLKQNKKYYLIQYKFLSKEAKLPISYAFIYSAIESLYYSVNRQKDLGPIHPSNEYFKNLLGIDARTVERAITKGVQIKALTVSYIYETDGKSIRKWRYITPRFKSEEVAEIGTMGIEYSDENNPKRSDEEIEAFHKLRPDAPLEVIEEMKQVNGTIIQQEKKEK